MGFAIDYMTLNFDFSNFSNSIPFSKSLFAFYQHSLDFIKGKIQ